MSDLFKNETVDTGYANNLADFTLELNEKIKNANFLDQDILSRFGYSVGPVNLVLKKQQRAEIITAPEICVIPNTPGFFKGVINLRGNIISVFDFEYFVNREAHDNTLYLLVLENNGQFCALSISNLPTLIKIETESDEIPEICPDVIKNNIHRIYHYNDAIWIEPDYVSLLDDIKNYF